MEGRACSQGPCDELSIREELVQVCQPCGRRGVAGYYDTLDAVREQESHDTGAQASDCLNGTISVRAVGLIRTEVLTTKQSRHFP